MISKLIGLIILLVSLYFFYVIGVDAVSLSEQDIQTILQGDQLVMLLVYTALNTVAFALGIIFLKSKE
jgi:hypothetical protein